MRRGLGTLEIVIGSIVLLALAGILISILMQTNMQGTVGDLQSCDEGIIATTIGPLLGENNRLGCFSSRFQPKFPKEEGEDCPAELGFKEENGFCVSDGSKNWQYIIKLGCTDEAPYCWAQTDEALSSTQQNSIREAITVCPQGSEGRCRGEAVGHTYSETITDVDGTVRTVRSLECVLSETRTHCYPEEIEENN